MGYSCLEGRLTLSLICAPSAGARYGSPYILHALWMAVDGREPSPSHHPPPSLSYISWHRRAATLQPPRNAQVLPVLGLTLRNEEELGWKWPLFPDKKSIHSPPAITAPLCAEEEDFMMGIK